MAQDPSEAQASAEDASTQDKNDDKNDSKVIKMRFKDEFQMPYIEIDASKLDTLTGEDLWAQICEKSEKYDNKPGNYKIMGHSV